MPPHAPDTDEYRAALVAAAARVAAKSPLDPSLLAAGALAAAVADLLDGAYRRMAGEAEEDPEVAAALARDESRRTTIDEDFAINAANPIMGALTGVGGVIGPAQLEGARLMFGPDFDLAVDAAVAGALEDLWLGKTG